MEESFANNHKQISVFFFLRTLVGMRLSFSLETFVSKLFVDKKALNDRTGFPYRKLSAIMERKLGLMCSYGGKMEEE